MKNKSRLVISLLMAMVMTLNVACTATPSPSSSDTVSDATSASTSSTETSKTDEQSSTSSTSETATETSTTKTDNALPAVNDKIGGFVVKSVTPMNVIGSTGILFEHEKNGAKLLYLASEDQNVSFDITFRTPALDDKGKPHVFEHMTICGSQKYPDPNLFFPFSSQTYNTFVNAMTYHGMTTYPLSTLSEKQLMPMMDYYLSGVFEPLMTTEPLLAKREAWRYELNNKEDPINITGTVYSEMQGALNTGRLSFSNNFKTMFKGGTTAYESGGIPEAIRTISYDELVKFHDSYYHPSNSLTVLYGKMDYEKFIKHIDTEYISKFDRKDIKVETGKVTPYNETTYATYEAPVEKTANVDNASYITYSFANNDISLEDTLGLSVLASVLNGESSHFSMLMKERFPETGVGISVSIDSPTPLFNFSVSSVNESDRDLFVKTIDEAIEKTMAEGISKDDLDALLSTEKLNLMLTSENATLGVDASQDIALIWAYFDSLDYYNAKQKVMDSISVEKLKSLMEKYVSNNKYRGVTVTKPVAGLAEEKAAALEKELADMKAKMTDEEIDKLIEETKAFTEWSTKPADQKIVSEFVNMTVDTMPETLVNFDVDDETKDGIRFITSDVDVGDMAQTTIKLDIGGIPLEQIYDAYLYNYVLGSMSTTKHTREEIDVLASRYLPGLSTSISAGAGTSAEVPESYSFTIGYSGLAEDAKKSAELLDELYHDTDIKNIKEIKDIIGQTLNYIPYYVDNKALDIQLSRLIANYSNTDAFNAYVDLATMNDYFTEMFALCDSKPEEVTARLEKARDLMLNRSGSSVICVGSEKAVDEFTAAIKDVLVKFPENKIPQVDYSPLKLNFKSEAIVNNSTVHMNILAGETKGFNGAYIPIGAIIDDRFMIPNLRNSLGAYGAYSSFGDDYNFLYTYRDPNLKNTFDVFAQLPEFLRTVDLSQADIDNYIIGSYSAFVSSSGQLKRAKGAINNYLLGVTDEERMRWRKEAKSVTIDDIRKTADVIDDLIKNGIRSSSGAKSIIEENKDFFDNIVEIGK